MALDLTEAVDAAARSWFDRGQSQRRDDGRHRPDGLAWQWEDMPAINQHAVRELVVDLVGAAAVVLEAQVRAQVAREIEQFASDRSYDSEENITESLLGAARIARGQS